MTAAHGDIWDWDSPSESLETQALGVGGGGGGGVTINHGIQLPRSPLDKQLRLFTDSGGDDSPYALDVKREH